MPNHPLPVVRSLPPDFAPAEAFQILSRIPGCLWLDTASIGPRTRSGHLGRYSFLTADPIDCIVATLGDPSPWPQLEAWANSLPQHTLDDLPPFQGGIAGLIGYESAIWLDSVGMALLDDFPTPAMSIGLYDWTIATDHQTNRSWIISQGLGGGSSSDRYRRAGERADQVQSWLANRQTMPVKSEPSTKQLGEFDTTAGVMPPNHVQTQHPNLWSNFSGDQFRAAVADIVDRIGRGDSFQVNLSQRLLSPATCSSPELYLRLRQSNPAPYGGYYAGTDCQGKPFEVLSSSPEGFLQIRASHIETRPIKGTVARTGDQATDLRLANELLNSEKDRAENTMIVDLMRNDLSRVCMDESVKVSQLCALEKYEHVQHLVSVVQGELEPDKTAIDALKACFPGGSVTGAPKIEAMRTIAQLEPHRRGPYCGSLGYISCGGNADFNILIRTVTAAGGHWQIPVGGGITARSEPESEEAETWTKSEGMLRAIRVSRGRKTP